MDKVLLDTSFCIRLLKSNDPFHQNAVDYYQYFLSENIEMFLSTIVVSEYSVKDDPDNLLDLQSFKILPFDYRDAKLAGQFYSIIMPARGSLGQQRSVVINDCKLIAQLSNRNFDAYVTKDRISKKDIVDKIDAKHKLNFKFIDIAHPLANYLGQLPF